MIEKDIFRALTIDAAIQDVRRNREYLDETTKLAAKIFDTLEGHKMSVVVTALHLMLMKIIEEPINDFNKSKEGGEKNGNRPEDATITRGTGSESKTN